MNYVTKQELKSFHSISNLCILFGVDKKWIRYVCEKHKIEPEYVCGVYGFSQQNAYLIQLYLRNCYSIFYDSEMFSNEASPIWDSI